MKIRRQAKGLPEGQTGRKRKSAFARVFASLFVLFALAMLGAGIAAIVGYNTFVAEGPLQQEKTVLLEKGLGITEIAGTLKREGIIENDNMFSAAAVLTGARGRLKAGEYRFEPGASMRQVMNKIASGDVILYKLTIPEGWTTEMALQRIREQEMLTGDLTFSPAEGEIMPATYTFGRGKARDDLVAEMVKSQAQLLEDLWNQRESGHPLKSMQEALVLASIVEKETAVPEERPRIAAVFLNRLAKNMRLQSDPTIIYGMVAGRGKLDRPLSRADIAQKTPYNTYQIDGLPPGPIANPGKDAIKAVLEPIKTNDLYFVADGSGGHAFAETLAAHNANVQKWRQIERNAGQVNAQETETQAAAAPAEEQAAAPEPVAEEQTATASPPPEGQPSQMPVMESLEGDTADQPAVETPPAAAPGDGEVAIAEPATPEEPIAPAASDAAEGTEQLRKPGEIIKVANRLVPIPVPKPKQP